MRHYRGFRITANGFSFHYTWSEARQAYVNDWDDTDLRTDIPKSTFRQTVVIDDWK